MTPLFSADAIDTDTLRRNLLTRILRASAVLGVLVYVPSVSLAWKHDMTPLVLLDTLGLAVVFTLLFIPRTPFALRAGVISFIYYALGVGLLLLVGSVGQVYLLGFSVIVVLLFGLRWGLASVALSAASMCAIGALGYSAPELAVQNRGHDPWGWAVVSLNFAMVSALVTMAVGSVLQAVATALQREVAHRASLDRERRTLRTLIDALPDVVFTKDRSGRFVNCNRATVALVGREREDEVAGKTVFELFASREMAEAYHADDMSVIAGRTLINREELSVDSAGRPVCFLTIKVPSVDADGAISGLVGISRDITAIKQADDERKRLLRIADEAAEEARRAEARRLVAEASNRAKSAFLAMMSHELRTPLNAILGFSEVLIDGKFGPTNDRQLRYLNNVLNSGRHLLGLINSLLDLSKVEAGKLEVTTQPCSMRQLVEDALSILQPLAAAKMQTLQMDGPDDLALPPVLADPVRCKQVLYNFISNAIKFTPDAGTVRVGCALRDDGRRVRVSIADTGRGIAANDLQRLFKPFEQLDRPEPNALGGTGLGLALNKQLVELMGGEVGVDSTPGVGSVFFFELPISIAPEPQRAPRVPAGTSPLALIVEDDDGARELMEMALQDNGYRTHAATTGESAIALATSLLPSVVLLDVFLPGIDGWEVLRALRNSPATAALPVVMATISSDRQRAFGLGAIEHLIKPLDRHALLAALDRHGFTAKVTKQPTHVLVIDDDRAHLSLVSAALQPEGFHVATAQTGVAGLERARRSPCDLVLLDLGLPDVSGVEVVAALREDVATRELPIVLVTAQDLSTELRDRLSGDVQLILSKGQLHVRDLVNEVNRLLGRTG